MLSMPTLAIVKFMLPTLTLLPPGSLTKVSRERKIHRCRKQFGCSLHSVLPVLECCRPKNLLVAVSLALLPPGYALREVR